MRKIYIFGVGKGKGFLMQNLLYENIELLGYIDNNASMYGEGLAGKKVLFLEEIEEDYDYIIVSVMRYKYINEQLWAAGVKKTQIINYFSFEDSIVEEYWQILDKNGWRIDAMAFEFEKKVRAYSYNLIYEMSDPRNSKTVVMPKVLSAEDAVDIIKKERKSLSRFGDGEFELMQMKGRSRYQIIDEELAERLKEIIKSSHENIIIAIADNYGSLEKYTEEAAEDIRAYMTPQIRREHMDVLDLEKNYYDAYLARPYIVYKNKEGASRRFEALKEIWKDKDIIIVEGAQTRLGVGNDLFAGASSVRRIIAPNENAFTKYDEILECVKKTVNDELIIVALGAAATVLTYDLAMSGYWALDLGHIDLEYEWYLAGVNQRRDIPYKYVNEINGGNRVCELPEHLQEAYRNEIVNDLS